MSTERNGPPVVTALRENYLEGFVRRGGSSVKIICGNEEDTKASATAILDAARGVGFATAVVDAASARVHLVQELFWAIAHEISWLNIAERFARRVLERTSFDYPVDAALSLARIAQVNDVSSAQVHKTVQQELRAAVLRNPNYTRSFKSVILALVGAAFDERGIDGAIGLRVVEWLRGEPSNRQMLRQANISRRITRQNARALLVDLARWLRDSGFPGLAVAVNISRYSLNRNQVHDQNRTYTPAAALDLFETIRQFIDGSDAASGLFLLFLTGPEFLYDEKRGLSAYAALKMRVLDEVYDSDRPNLMSPLLMVSR